MTAHIHCAWMITASGSIEKTSVSDSHLANSLRVAWPRGFPLSLCPGLETIFWSAEEGYHMLRKTPATLGVPFLSCWTRGKFDKRRIASLCCYSPTLTRSLSMSDTSLSLVFYAPLRMQIRWKNFGQEKHNVWAVMPSPMPQSCLLPLFSPPTAAKHQTLLNSCLY